LSWLSAGEGHHRNSLRSRPCDGPKARHSRHRRRIQRSRKRRWKTSSLVSQNRSSDTWCPSIGWNGPTLRCLPRKLHSEIRKSAWRKLSKQRPDDKSTWRQMLT
jgi:hypothetical protein